MPARNTINHQQESKAHDRGGLTVVLAFVGLVCVVYLFDPTGWLGSDDSAYYNAAEQILYGETIHRVHHHPSRLSAILPVTLSLAIFGHHPYAVILPAFLAGVAFDPLRLDEMSTDDNLATFGEVLVADAGEVAPRVDVDPYASASVAGFA